MGAVSNFEYCMPFDKAASDLKAGTFVCLNEDNEIDNIGSDARNISRVIGVCNSNTPAGKTVPSMSFPGQRAVVRLKMGANQSVSAGDAVKTDADGNAVKLGGSDNQALALGVVLGPEYKTGTATGDGTTVTANEIYNTAIILR